MSLSDHTQSKSPLHQRARGIVGDGLRQSPAPVKAALTKASRRVLATLGELDATPVESPREPVWVTPELPLPPGLALEDVEKTFRSWSVGGEPVGHMDNYVTDSRMRFLYTWGL